MPVKAKPVEYVKICTLYGAGFYYIPGTDTCIKIGGYIRVQVDHDGGGGGIADGSGPQMAGQARYTRDLTNDINYRVRGVVTFDARNQTDYGTLRSYIRAGWENTTPAATGGGTTSTSYWDRAFIQFAGFTVGRAQSMFDMFTYGGAYSYLNVRTAGDTGASGQNLWAYTVQFGNGVSYTLSFEDPATRKGAGTCDNTSANFFGNTAPLQRQRPDRSSRTAPDQFGFRVPDIITNLRVDQAWGYAGISTAIHDASGAYYGRQQRQQRTSGRQVRLGVLGLGLLNLQGGDIIGVNFVYAKGATGYATNSSWWQFYSNSNSRAMAWASDGIFGTGSDVELTEAWSINAGYQHIWGAAGTFGGKWRTSVYGGYVVVNYNDRATQLINSRLRGRSACNPGAGIGDDRAVHPARRQLVQPGLQLLSDRFADPVQPAPADGYRSRRRLHQGQLGLLRPGELGGERLAAGLHQQRDPGLRRSQTRARSPR